MKSAKTYAIILLALTTIGGAALAWQQYQELIELRAAAMNKDERADLQKRIWDLEKANRELTDQLASQRTDTAADILVAAADSEQPAPERGGRGERGGRSRGNNGVMQQALNELLARPETVAVLTAQRKLDVERQYAALFRNLNLSPEQAEKLKSILADRQNTMQDARNLAQEQNLTPQDRRKLFEQTQAEINGSIRSVIGDGGLAQLRTYEQTLPQRNLVNDLQQRLSYTSTPLTLAQSEQLVQILAANQPARPVNPPPGQPNQPGQPGQGRMGGRGDGGGDGGGMGPGFGGRGGDGGAIAAALLGGAAGNLLGGGNGAVITPAAVNQAQSVLAAPQLSALQQLQQQQQAQRQLQQAVRQTLQQNTPPPTNQPGTGGNRRRGGGG